MRPLYMDNMDNLVEMALKEDLGKEQIDVTSDNVFEGHTAKAVITARQHLVVSGIYAAQAVYSRIDPQVNVKILQKDGAEVPPGTAVAEITGSAVSVMKGERIVLNFMQRMCGVATMTAEYVKALGEKVRLLDTRKTLPGYRFLDKYAVTCGGGKNHRMGLYDMAMIKDNHKEAGGGALAVLKRLKEKAPDVPIEVEAETVDEAVMFAEEGCDVIMLDNMDNESVKKAAAAIRKIDPSVKIEVSGSVTIERLHSLGVLDIDYVSTGAVTHSAPAADLAMDIILD